MNVQQTLAADPKTRVAISDRPYLAGGKQFNGAGGIPGGGGCGAPSDKAKLAPFFVQTLGKEDMRRPPMQLGLGIWTAKTHRYYPVSVIRDTASMEGAPWCTLIRRRITRRRFSLTPRPPNWKAEKSA